MIDEATSAEAASDDPGERLALLDAERARVTRALQPDPRVIYGTWGLAWLVGFLVFWSSASASSPVDTPVALAAVVYGVCILGAIVLTVVHISRRTAGRRGVSSTIGAMYGWAWFAALVAEAAIINALYQYGVDRNVGAILWCTISGLVVGTLYMAGGAIWQDWLQFRLGVWVLLTSAVAAFAGYPSVYLVMGFMGGGGFLLAALYYAVRRA
ncbi:hypothetical protein ACIB24_08155 [Spongisporangium articulatum]|uniref:Transporter n=1 Tax=Spongisporangium articulatum TaxID=3362603 RepID=A0ABW8AM54_9ACTN